MVAWIEKKNVLFLIIFLAVIIVIMIYSNYSKNNEHLIGGCAGVSLDNLQECCNNYARGNNIELPTCVGNWIIESGNCSWKCEEESECQTDSDCPSIVCVSTPCYQNKCINGKCELEINKSEFCGSSTNFACSSDSDCKIGGCSSQVCQGKNEEDMITTCEYKDCYNSEKFNLNCRCENNKCKWD